jgi:hypothetical protein
MEGFEFLIDTTTIITHWKGTYRGIICRIEKFDTVHNGINPEPLKFNWTAGLRGQGTCEYYGDAIKNIKHTIDMSKQHEENAGYFLRGEK